MVQPSHHSHNSSSASSYGGKGLAINTKSVGKRQLISQQLTGAAVTVQDNSHSTKDRNSQILINGLSSARHDQNSVRFTGKTMAAGNLYNNNDPIVVAVNAAKLTRHALEWALTNVVQPGDHILLIALWPVRKQWSLFSGECARRTIHLKKSSIKHIGKHLIDLEDEINDSCASMMEELHALCGDRKAKVSVKVLPDKEKGAIAVEAERVGASWVVLDKHVMKKEGKICLEKLHCNVVLVKHAMSSKILRLNLRGGVGISRRINSTAFPDMERKRKGNSKRRSKLNSGTTESKRHYNGFYHDASTDQDVGSSGSCSPDHVYNAVGTPFTATGSETDNSAAVGDLRYNATNYDELLHRLGQALAAEDVHSDYGNGGELDMELYPGDDVINGEHSSGLLCTPVTSPSPETLVHHKARDTNRFLERAGNMAPESDDEDDSVMNERRQPPPWLDNPYNSERVMISMFREVWKPAPPYNTAPSLISSRPPSASTTPKSDTLTLTGSSYPRVSRSPSPVPSCNNTSVPPLSQSKQQQAAAIPAAARASRSPSPGKSGPSVNNHTSQIKATNSQTSSNAIVTSSVASNTTKPTVSRIHDSFVKCAKQGTTNSNNDTCTNNPTQPSDPPGTILRGVGRTESGRVITTRELLQRFSEWDHHQGSSKSQRMTSLNVAPAAVVTSTSPLSESHTSDRLSDVDVRQEAAPSSPLKYSGDQQQLDRASSVRRAMSIAGGGGAAEIMQQSVLPGPPPLCSICQHKAPVFGKPPRRFTYAELEMATGGFSKVNFLAEGGFGSVHRGILPDGQAVAVKQHKLASSQGDIEFCSEVEVLSCAQHRNVVMLIGYCIEAHRRLLVYEFICNGSLDSHLYGGDNRPPLPWAARQKVAVGAARGLRYLHEECRVGCIIHRDMRPNNILLTHDYEPMVGDFGLARWQPDGDLGVQTRVIGTFGYLAPEYAQSGEVTEKADVYSFGVVLLELVTGRKAVDIGRPKGQQCLTEWARPLLEEGGNHTPLQDLVDPRLEGHYSQYELYCTIHAAALCIRKDPHLRPRMSQVLRILEGDVIIDANASSPLIPCSVAAPAKASYNGSRSSRITGETSYRRTDHHHGAVHGSSRRRAGSVSPPLVSYSGSILSSDGVSLQSQPRRIEKQLCYDAIRNMAEAYAKRLSFEGSA